MEISRKLVSLLPSTVYPLSLPTKSIKKHLPLLLTLMLGYSSSVFADSFLQIFSLNEHTDTLLTIENIAKDSSDNIYFVSSYYGPSGPPTSPALVKIDPLNGMSTIFDKERSSAQLNFRAPYDIAVSANGFIYVSGQSSNNVIRIDANGTVSVIVDEFGDGLGNKLGGAGGLALDKFGNVYVAAYQSGQVFKIDTNLNVQNFEAVSSGSLRVFRPQHVALDSANNVYVPGYISNDVIKIKSNGEVTKIIDQSGDGTGNNLNGTGNILKGADKIVLDKFDNVFVTGRDSNNVFRISTNGTITEIIDSTGDGRGAELNRPGRMVTDSKGNLYLVGENSCNVFRIEPDGGIVEILNENNVDARGNKFNCAYGMTIDKEDSILLSGRGNIYKYTPDHAYEMETANYGSKFLTIPSVSALGANYRVVLELINADPLKFHVISAEILNYLPREDSSSLVDQTLNVPIVRVGTLNVALKLTLVDSEALVFRLDEIIEE